MAEVDKELWNQFVEKARACGVDHDNLLDEFADLSDWGVAIQAGAVMEAAATHTLILAIGRPPLQKRIERMPIAAKLDWLAEFTPARFESESWKLILQAARAIMSIRNQYAHDIRNVNKSVADVCGSLAPGVLASIGPDPNRISVIGTMVLALVGLNMCDESLSAAEARASWERWRRIDEELKSAALGRLLESPDAPEPKSGDSEV